MMKLIINLTLLTHVLTHVLTLKMSLQRHFDALTLKSSCTCARAKIKPLIQLRLIISRAYSFYVSIASIASIVSIYKAFRVDAYILYASIASINLINKGS